MIILSHKFEKFHHKLENHNHHHDHYHHHQSQELSSSLHGFRSKLSDSISQLTSESEILSFSWIQKSLGLFPIVHKAFAKLIVEIDYPMSKWESESVEEFLGYSMILLDLFNSISSSLSHLAQDRMSLSHGLSLLENSPSSAIKHLKPIHPGSFNPNFSKETKDRELNNFSGKERVVREAVKELKSIGFLICGIFLSGLCSDSNPYMEMRKMAGGFDDSSVSTLDSVISEKLLMMEKKPLLKEIKEINDSVANFIVDSDAVKLDVAKELQEELHVLEKLLDDVSKEVDDLFAKVMNQRTELIDCFRLRKQ